MSQSSQITYQLLQNLIFSHFLLLFLIDVVLDFWPVQYTGIQGELLVKFTSLGAAVCAPDSLYSGGTAYFGISVQRRPFLQQKPLEVRLKCLDLISEALFYVSSPYKKPVLAH